LIAAAHAVAQSSYPKVDLTFSRLDLLCWDIVLFQISEVTVNPGFGFFSHCGYATVQ